MTKAIRVVFSTIGFDGWGGGCDFADHLISSLANINDTKIEKYLAVAKRDPGYFYNKYILPLKVSVVALFRSGVWRYNPSPRLSPKEILHRFQKYQKSYAFSQPGSSLSDIELFCKIISANVLMPCIEPPSNNFKTPWIGYLYDCQHKYYPEFFSKQEISTRDASFSRLLNSATDIIVNSNSAKNDLSNFFGPFSARIHALPFSPASSSDFIYENRDLRHNYGISEEKNYFIVSNQFWKHKNHELLFRAFAKMSEFVGTNWELVCTGSTTDHRFPGYGDYLKSLCQDLGLNERIKILGRIPKLDQIALMKTSYAVIQPTLFEGGPGGGSGYDAIGLGLPLLISDIPVNREVRSNFYLRFFDPLSTSSLVEAMVSSIESNLNDRPTTSALLNNSAHYTNKLGEALLRIVNSVCE